MTTNDSTATASEIGKRLVAFCQEGKGLEAVDALYDEQIISIEAQGSDELPARLEGLAILDNLEQSNTGIDAWIWVTWSRAYLLDRLRHTAARDESIAELERAFEADPYNVQVYNMLNVTDTIAGYSTA